MKVVRKCWGLGDKIIASDVDKGYIADIVIALNNIYKNEDSAIWFKAESGANDGTE